MYACGAALRRCLSTSPGVPHTSDSSRTSRPDGALPRWVQLRCTCVCRLVLLLARSGPGCPCQPGYFHANLMKQRSQVQRGGALIGCRTDRRPRRKEGLETGSLAVLRSQVQRGGAVIGCRPDRSPRREGLEGGSLALPPPPRPSVADLIAGARTVRVRARLELSINKSIPFLSLSVILRTGATLCGCGWMGMRGVRLRVRGATLTHNPLCIIPDLKLMREGAQTWYIIVATEDMGV